jgi:hypothetical protein
LEASTNLALFGLDFFTLGGNACLTAAIDMAFKDGYDFFKGDQYKEYKSGNEDEGYGRKDMGSEDNGFKFMKDLLSVSDAARLAFDGYDCASYVLLEQDWTAVFDWETPFFLEFEDMSSSIDFDWKTDTFDYIDAGVQLLGLILTIIAPSMGEYEPLDFFIDAPRFMDAFWRLFIALAY